MKIIACKNRFDDDMVELYTDSERPNNRKYMFGTVHIDRFITINDSSIYTAIDALEDGEEIVLRVSVDKEE